MSTHPGSAGSFDTAALRPAVIGALLLLAAFVVAAGFAMRLPAPSSSMGLDAPSTSAHPGSAPLTREHLVRQTERDARDGRAWALLAYADLEAGRYVEAAVSFERAIAVNRRVAGDPAVWCDYADALGMAQGGSLAGRPTEHVMHALALRPDHPKALEMAGSAAYERRDFVIASQYWRRLQAQLVEDSQAHRELSAAIARADRLAATSLSPAR